MMAQPEQRAPEAIGIWRSDEEQWSHQASDRDVMGARILFDVNAVERAVRIYELNNRTVLHILDDLGAAIADYRARVEKEVLLEIRGEEFLLSGAPVRLGFKAYKRARELRETFRERGIRGLIFPPSITRQQLQIFFARLRRVGFAYDPESRPLLEQIHRESGVEIRPSVPMEETSAELDADRFVVRLYGVLMVLYRDLLAAARERKRSSLVPLKRAIQEISDRLEGREGLFLALMDLPDFAGRNERHFANVTILALAFGQRLGLAASDLLELGLTAGFHDIERAFVPEDVHGRKERGHELSSVEREVFEAAPWKAVRYALQGPSLRSNEAVSRLVVAFEARREFEESAPYGGELPMSYASKLLAIVNAYEILVRPIGNWDPMLPAEAIRWLLEEGAERFDATLLQAFVRMMGLFPAGSLVQLRTGELAVVARPSSDERHAGFPTVVVIRDPEGQPVPPQEVDLVRDRSRTIRAPLWPADYGVDAHRYFLCTSDR